MPLNNKNQVDVVKIHKISKYERISVLILLILIFSLEVMIFSKNNDKMDASINFHQNINYSTITNTSINLDGNTQLDLLFNLEGTDGSYNNPHILENSSIDSLGLNPGIKISNTDRYLIIRNCTILNGGDLEQNAGIYLENCSNIQILNSNFNNNSYGF